MEAPTGIHSHQPEDSPARPSGMDTSPTFTCHHSAPGGRPHLYTHTTRSGSSLYPARFNPCSPAVRLVLSSLLAPHAEMGRRYNSLRGCKAIPSLAECFGLRMLQTMVPFVAVARLRLAASDLMAWS